MYYLIETNKTWNVLKLHNALPKYNVGKIISIHIPVMIFTIKLFGSSPKLFVKTTTWTNNDQSPPTVGLSC